MTGALRPGRGKPWAWMVAGPLAVAWVGFGMGGSAAADNAPILEGFSYSADGTTYTDAVPDLFANAPALIPGESVEARLWVRNDNAVAVNVAVAGQPLDAALRQAEVAPSSTVTLAPGSAAPLLVRAGLPTDAGNATQNQTWPLRLQVAASEAVDGGTAGPGTGGGGTAGNELGNTGTTPGLWQLAGTLLLVGLGGLFGARLRGSGQGHMGRNGERT